MRQPWPDIVSLLRLVRQDHIHCVFAVAAFLGARQAAASAVGDARLSDFFVGNCVVVQDVGGADDAGHAQFAQLVIHLDFLTPGDDQRAVRQLFNDQCRDLQVDFFAR